MTRRKRRLVASVAATASAMITTLVATASASAGCAHATQIPTSVAQARTATLCLLNKQRRHHHLAPLRREAHLEKAATAYSHEMARQRFFDHVAPDGSTPVQRVEATGYGGWTSIGENIGWGSGRLATPASIVAAWMHSPLHRANILRSAFRQIGVGIAPGAPDPGVSGDAAVYTTDFARPR